MTQQSRKGRVPQALIATFLILLIIVVIFLRLSVWTPFVILLNSMEPTLLPNDHVLVNRWAYRHHPPQPGDIILFQHPQEALSFLLVKRVIGVPGDHLAIVGGYVFRNGVLLDEHAYTSQDPLRVKEFVWGTVPPDTVFVLGDNRNHSEDSRDYGAVPLENIVGRGVLIFWPPSRWRRLDRPRPSAPEGGGDRAVPRKEGGEK